MPKKNTYPYAIQVRNVKRKGRGVFATRAFKRGELIERCPVLVIPANQTDNVLESNLEHYAFDWDKDDISLLLGYGMIYNHSYQPNAEIVHDLGSHTSDIIARTTIEADEEILVNYNGSAKDKSPLWFDVVETKVKKAS